jgi:hypothetical protein
LASRASESAEASSSVTSPPARAFHRVVDSCG